MGHRWRFEVNTRASVLLNRCRLLLVPLAIFGLAACNGKPDVDTEHPEPGPPQFVHTSLTAEHCAAEAPATGTRVRSMCTGLGDYRLAHTSHEHGSSIDLVLEGETVGLRYIVHGSKADVHDEHLEWRYTGSSTQPRVHGLIYRVNYLDGLTGEPTGILMVVRVDGDRACVVGTETSYEEARKIADDKERTCG